MTAEHPDNLKALPLRLRYSTGRNNLVGEFFNPCLRVATNYDRAVGFFSSTLYLLIGVAVADFARRGGMMRIVCCPRLSDVDIRAMQEGYTARAVGASLVRDMKSCFDDPVGKAVTTLLATLIASAHLDVRVAFRPGASGIYHDKVGLFEDADHSRVSFDGSANKSWSAWSDWGNYEAFHVFCDWIEPNRVREDAAYFESLWANEEPGLVVMSFPDVAKERLEAIADPEGLNHAEATVLEALTADTHGPAGGRPRLREHQTRVLEDWRAKLHRGIVVHATGSGKTLTGLEAATEALAVGYAVLVVVPGVTLLDQWRDVATGYWGEDVRLLLAGAGHNEWRSRASLRNFLEPGARRAVLVTIDTALSPEFLSKLRGLHPLMAVFDEVHRAGSFRRRMLLGDLDADWRLGLSATWEREGDDVGTAAILQYFEHVLRPEYTLADAVNDGYLSQYRYLIHVVQLTPEEQRTWLSVSQRISKAFAFAKGEVTKSIRHSLYEELVS